MSKYDIVNELAKNKTVEKMLTHFSTINKDDLSQNIYLSLLCKDENMLNELYSNGRINQYISGIVYRQIFSDHSHHYCQNVKRIGEPIVRVNKDGETYEEILIHDDTPPHELENEVDDYLNSLTEMDREILLLQLVEKYKRTEDINNICNRYKISKRKYIRLVPQIKEKFAKHFTDFKTKNKEKGKYNATKVQMINFKTDEVIKTFSNLGECKLELVPKGFKITSIYACLGQKQKQYCGYAFRYID